MPRYEIRIWDPEKDSYALFSVVDANSDDEARGLYKEQQRKYKSEPRHQMIKSPRITRIETVRTRIPWRPKRSR